VKNLTLGATLRVSSVKLRKIVLIFFVYLFLEVFGFMLIDKVVIRVSKVHENKKDHDASDHKGIKGYPELLVFAKRVV
jgi:hypothetical protein